MSWSYSPGLVEEYSEANFSDTGLSALLNMTPTPDQFYWPDKPTEHSRISRFGMMCEPLTAIRGEALLTWYQAGFRAKTLALQETGPDLTASDQVSGQKWQGSLAKYYPVTHSLKTAQHSLLEDLTGCSVTLPRWGLMRDGELFQQPTPALAIGGKESGYWPTPNALDYKGAPGAGCVERGGRQSSLPQSVKLRTYPTATATAYKGWSPNHNRANSDDRLDYTIERESFQPGQQTPPMRLNPNWVEWLMGWPIGHTDLKPLATDRFREFEQQHGLY